MSPISLPITPPPLSLPPSQQGRDFSISQKAPSALFEKQHSFSQKLYSYTDPLKRNTIEVLYDANNGLEAYIYSYATGGYLAGPLKVDNLPRELNKRRIDHLKSYLQLCHLTPRKSIDYRYVGVSAHITGRGGAPHLIPYMEGLSLGSVVQIEGSDIDAMNQYAINQTERTQLEVQLTNAEEEIQRATLKKENLLQRLEKREIEEEELQKLAEQNWQLKSSLDQITLYTNFKKVAMEKYNQLNLVSLPILTGFRTGAASPIKWGEKGTKVITLPLGSSQTHFSSQYITMESTLSQISEKISAGLLSSEVPSRSMGWTPLIANSKAALETKALRRIEQIKTDETARGVLIIKASFSTGYVRRLADIEYDIAAVENIYSAMGSSNKSMQNYYGVSGGEKGKIHILSEAILGGDFIGLVTFKSTQEGRNFPSIEFFARGAIPASVRGQLEREIYQHRDLLEDIKDNSSDTFVKKREQSVDTVRSLMAAYDSFAAHRLTDENAGAPIAFKYTSLSYNQLCYIQADLGNGRPPRY